MTYMVTTRIPSLGSDTAGCAVFCDTLEEAMDEIRTVLERLEEGESLLVEKQFDDSEGRFDLGCV